jgi:hypothetical protein
MAKQERQLLYNFDVGSAYWQYRHNPTEYEIRQPQPHVNQSADDTWIVLLGILGTIGFLVILAKEII